MKIADDKILLEIDKKTVMILEQVNGELVVGKVKFFLLVLELRRNLFAIGSINDKKF